MDKIDANDPLVEWNRLNKENAEHGFASALFKSMCYTSPAVDKFSLWLMGGTGATGALLVSQIDSVLPHLTTFGFKACLGLLILSGAFGFLAKYKALRCQIQTEVDVKLAELLAPVFAKHEEDEKRIHQIAEQRGIALATELNFSNVILEFTKPFPAWVRWLIQRQTSKSKNKRQAGYHIAVRAYVAQLRYTFFQAVSFLLFLFAAGWYAGPT